jgi:hypothetical protein
MSARGKEVSDMDGKLFLFQRNGPAKELRSFPVPDVSAVRDIISASLFRLEDSLGSGAYFRSLPEELQVEDHMLTLDIAGLLEFLKGLEPVEMEAEVVTEQMREHLGKTND